MQKKRSNSKITAKKSPTSRRPRCPSKKIVSPHNACEQIKMKRPLFQKINGEKPSDAEYKLMIDAYAEGLRDGLLYGGINPSVILWG